MQTVHLLHLAHQRDIQGLSQPQGLALVMARAMNAQGVAATDASAGRNIGCVASCVCVYSLCTGESHGMCPRPRRSQLQALEKAIAQVDRVGSEAHELSKANQATVLSVESTLAAMQEVGATVG